MSDENVELVWTMLTCPHCGLKFPLPLMSLQATCECGMVYIDCDWNGLKKGFHPGYEISRAKQASQKLITVELTEEEFAYLTSMMDEVMEVTKLLNRIVTNKAFNSMHAKVLATWREHWRNEPKPQPD